MVADLSGINHFPKARRRSATQHYISFKKRWHCNPVLFHAITLGKFFPKAPPKRFFETVFLLLLSWFFALAFGLFLTVFLRLLSDGFFVLNSLFSNRPLRPADKMYNAKLF